MRFPAHAIVLNIVRHSDSTDVATLYTREHGRVSVAIPARSSKRRSKNPSLMPLSIIEGEISTRSGSNLARLWSYTLVEPMSRLRIDPTKNAIGMFVAEFLGRLLREQAPDPKLWQAILNSLLTLNAEDNTTRIANFHLVFLWQMLAPTGIMPDLDRYTPHEMLWFDMRGGCYTSVRPAHSDILAPQFAQVPPVLARMNFRNSHLLKLNGDQRYRICEVLLHYYSVHLPGLGSMHTHHILRIIFA